MPSSLKFIVAYCWKIGHDVPIVVSYYLFLSVVMSEARAQAFDGLYQALGTRDGERSIYRLAKGRERKD